MAALYCTTKQSIAAMNSNKSAKPHSSHSHTLDILITLSMSECVCVLAVNI